MPTEHESQRCPTCLSDSRVHGNMQPCTDGWHIGYTDCRGSVHADERAKLVSDTLYFPDEEMFKLRLELFDVKQQRNGYDHAHKVQAAKTLELRREVIALREELEHAVLCLDRGCPRCNKALPPRFTAATRHSEE